MQIKDLITWAHKNGSPDAKSSEDNAIATLQREMNHVFENFWTSNTSFFIDMTDKKHRNG